MSRSLAAALLGSILAPVTPCLKAAEFVRTIQHRQALPIGCLEEIAYRQGWIDIEALTSLVASLKNTRYGASLELMLRSCSLRDPVARRCPNLCSGTYGLQQSSR